MTKFTITTEKGTKIEMESGMSITVDIDNKTYEISIEEK